VTAFPDVLVVDHPLARERLSVLRDAGTDRARFRRALGDLAGMLIYEATRELPVVDVEVATPLTTTSGVRLADPPLLVPVLRAGLGMLSAGSVLLPDSPIGFVGLERDEQTLQPRAYLISLPPDLAGAAVLLLDPMLATGGSLLHAIDVLRQRGAGAITVVCALAAPEGLAALAELSAVRVVTASVDERLDDRGFIVPGLGDAGDRQFDA
jgi:uracil phosphoribosyltransferase